MERQRKVSVDDGYITALGRAAYTYSYLEWGSVWLAEKLRPGFLQRVSGMTAGTIAREFERAATDCGDADAPALQALATIFIDLVGDRNALLHGLPYTANGGEQRLLHLGPKGRRDWTEELILDAARRFETAAADANRLLHAGRYETYTAATSMALSVQSIRFGKERS
jgi:hypothetical protein